MVKLFKKIKDGQMRNLSNLKEVPPRGSIVVHFEKYVFLGFSVSEKDRKALIDSNCSHQSIKASAASRTFRYDAKLLGQTDPDESF